MRISSPLFAFALFAVTTMGAQAQQTATTAKIAGVPSGFSFNYDAQQKQIVGSGFQLKASTIKSNSVSPTTGMITVTVYINAVSSFEQHEKYLCSVYALGGILDLNSYVVEGGVETANVTAFGSNSTLRCVAKIPYSWTLPEGSAPGGGLILAFSAAAVDTAGNVDRSTLQVDGIEGLPANGATASYVYHVAL